MPTRIKRYEDRLDNLDGLLERIETEMGPQARLEMREFSRGRVLGLFGGQKMVEIVATLDVDTESQATAQASGSDNGHPDPVETTRPIASATDILDSPGSDPAPAIPANRRTIDLTADEPCLTEQVESHQDMLAESIAASADPIVEPLTDKPFKVPEPAAAEPEQVEADQPEADDTAASKSTETKSNTPVSTGSGDLADIRESISELRNTLNELVLNQRQTRASDEPLTEQGTGLLFGNNAPEATESGDPAAKHHVVDLIALDPASSLGQIQRQAYDRLLDWNIGPYDAIELINTAFATIETDELSEEALLQTITRDICRNVLLDGGIQLKQAPPGKVVALIGSTGVGKTTTIAKLAAHFAFQGGRRVSLVSLDNYRIAAAEQLRTYTDIMGIDLDIVFSREEFDTVLTQQASNDLVLVDTAGRSPLNTRQVFELRDVFSIHPPDEVHLVVSASTKADDLRTMLENFQPLSYDHIIVSKLDETRSLGCIYNINKLSKIPISYFTVGQSVPEDIRTATLGFIQAWIEQGRII